MLPDLDPLHTIDEENEEASVQNNIYIAVYTIKPPFKVLGVFPLTHFCLITKK